MCSREEVQDISDRAEHRMEARLFDSHMAVAKSISDFGNDLKELRSAVNDHLIQQGGMPETLESILEQARTTNGRIKSLERWRSFIGGGLAVLTALVVPVFIAVIIGSMSK